MTMHPASQIPGDIWQEMMLPQVLWPLRDRVYELAWEKFSFECIQFCIALAGRRINQPGLDQFYREVYTTPGYDLRATLKKGGIDTYEATLFGIFATHEQRQQWKSFLRNAADELCEKVFFETNSWREVDEAYTAACLAEMRKPTARRLR